MHRQEICLEPKIKKIRVKARHEKMRNLIRTLMICAEMQGLRFNDDKS
jgi:hypothetical protein